jgi:hypothetical protein
MAGPVTGQRRIYPAVTAPVPGKHRIGRERLHGIHTTSTRGLVMTSHTIQPLHHLSAKTAALALGALGLAVAAGFGIAAVTLDEQVTSTPGPIVVQAPAAQPGSDAYDGTDREGRALMHRRR